MPVLLLKVKARARGNFDETEANVSRLQDTVLYLQ